MELCMASSTSRASVRAAGNLRTKNQLRGKSLPRAYPERPILQLHNRQHLTLDDIRDAYEVCSLIPAANERAQCYSVFGIDSTRMLEYYETVLKLEEELETQTASRSGFWDEDDHQLGAST